MGKRAQPQRHGELLAILVRKPSWIGAARVRDNETDVQVASRVGQSSDESLVREIGNDDGCFTPKSRESSVPSASSKACRRATSTTLMCEAPIWRANSRPIPDEAPVMSAQGPNRLLSTFACITVGTAILLCSIAGIELLPRRLWQQRSCRCPA